MIERVTLAADLPKIVELPQNAADGFLGSSEDGRELGARDRLVDRRKDAHD